MEIVAQLFINLSQLHILTVAAALVSMQCNMYAVDIEIKMPPADSNTIQS